MNCKKCGNKINDGDNFCSMCGTKVGDDRANLNANDSIDKSKNTIKNNQENMMTKGDYEKIKSSIYIIFFLLGIIGMSKIDDINFFSISFVVSAISIVTGFLRCPKNKVISNFFMLFIISVPFIFLLYLVSGLIDCGRGFY